MVFIQCTNVGYRVWGNLDFQELVRLTKKGYILVPCLAPDSPYDNKISLL